MDKSKKILLLSLLPGLLTLLFIVYVVTPTTENMMKVKDDLAKETAEYNQNLSQLSGYKANNALYREVQGLRTSLADFDVKVPSEYNTEILLFDMERFANSFKLKLLSLNTRQEKPLILEDPNTPKDSQVKSRRKKKLQEQLPVQVIEIPVEIKVLGFYPDILNFVKAFENYQRKIVIDEIEMKEYAKDKGKADVRAEITLKCRIYRSILTLSSITAPEENPVTAVQKTVN